jgi:FHA domain
MDKDPPPRENRHMLRPGNSRRQLARTLNTAYADGLLSEETFLLRLDQVLEGSLIDSRRLVGDLQLRASGRGLGARLAAIGRAVANRFEGFASRHREPPALLALDWTGAPRELLVGRHQACDVVLEDLAVSRRHARLVHRDGTWVIQDLASRNGTLVNGVRVGRTELRPGDRLLLGDTRLLID